MTLIVLETYTRCDSATEPCSQDPVCKKGHNVQHCNCVWRCIVLFLSFKWFPYLWCIYLSSSSCEVAYSPARQCAPPHLATAIASCVSLSAHASPLRDCASSGEGGIIARWTNNKAKRGLRRETQKDEQTFISFAPSPCPPVTCLTPPLPAPPQGVEGV